MAKGSSSEVVNGLAWYLLKGSLSTKQVLCRGLQPGARFVFGRLLKSSPVIMA